MSLRVKFTLYISFLILLIISGISASIFYTQRQLLLSQLEENRNRIFKDFTYTCNEALVVKDEIQVLNTIRSVIKTHHPAIAYAGYVSPSGVILFNARENEKEESFRPRIFKVSRPANEDFTSDQSEKIREFSFPVYIQNDYRGTIKAGFSQTYLESEIKKGVVLLAEKILQVSVLALLAALILANFVAFFLNKPIKALARAADEIGNGNLDTQVKIKSSDELGRLGKRFNEMGRKLKELDEMKDAFVSSVSHELRSPLAAIDGYCDYMIDGMAKNLPQDKQEKSLKIIKEATIRLTNFINNILDIAKIKAGKFEMRKVSVSMADMVNEIVSLFETLAANQKKVLKAAVDPVIPPVMVDPEKIKQVVTNLIGNALKFTPENAEITVSAHYPAAPHPKYVKPEETREYIEVWIADTGVGIPPDALDKVFDKFYQVTENNMMKKPKGTGLGLAIVAEIVKLHEGKIWAESTLGKGSTFKFILPVTNNDATQPTHS